MKEALNQLKEPVATTIVNYQEVMFGLDVKKEAFVEEEGYYDELFDQLYLLELTRKGSKKAVEIFNALAKQGQTTGKFDSVIACIFLEQDVTKVITRNVKHFRKMKGIEVIPY